MGVYPTITLAEAREAARKARKTVAQGILDPMEEKRAAKRVARLIKNPDGNSPNGQEIVKKECYVFDFAPDRALRQIADYSCSLNINESNPEKNVAEFIHFLPVLAYNGSSMKQINAACENHALILAPFIKSGDRN